MQIPVSFGLLLTFGSFLRWDILFYSRSFGLVMFFMGHLDHSLVPVLFLAGNALFIGAFAASQQIRTTINIAAVAAFMAYTGAGTEGAAGLGDYNLALDDSYRGQVVKGCPAYDEVRQPTMNNFDLNSRVKVVGLCKNLKKCLSSNVLLHISLCDALGLFSESKIHKKPSYLPINVSL